MKLSVIIATYNRKHELEELFKSLKQQTLPHDHYEVIVVDDGSTDGTDAFIEDIKVQMPFTVRYFFQQNRGPGNARNLGMQKAGGDIFIFIDSDCLTPSHYLQTVHDAFGADTFDAYGGPDRSAETFSSWDKAVNFNMTSFLTTGGIRGSAGKKLARYYPRTFNMGLRRSLFQRVGGFKPMYQGEDIEFSNRMRKSGARIAYLNQAFVYHKRRSTPDAFIKQVYRMGKARVELVRIDRTLLEPLHLIPSLGVIIFAAVLILTLFHQSGSMLLPAFMISVLLLTVLLSIIGYRSTRDVTAALLIPVVFFLQVSAYGIGMIIQAIKSMFIK